MKKSTKTKRLTKEKMCAYLKVKKKLTNKVVRVIQGAWKSKKSYRVEKIFKDHFVYLSGVLRINSLKKTISLKIHSTNLKVLKDVSKK